MAQRVNDVEIGLDVVQVEPLRDRAAEHGLLSQMVTPRLDIYTYINIICTYYIHIYQYYMPVLNDDSCGTWSLVADGHATAVYMCVSMYINIISTY